jgi:hypothetical protein
MKLIFIQIGGGNKEIREYKYTFYIIQILNYSLIIFL